MGALPSRLSDTHWYPCSQVLTAWVLGEPPPLLPGIFPMGKGRPNGTSSGGSNGKGLSMEEVLHTIAEYLALAVNLLAMLAIAFGSIQGAIGLSRLLLFNGSEEELRPVWLSLGRWLVAGLTFQLAADIVETTIAPNWDDIGKLAAIAVLRTFLNYFLDRDMDSLRERAERRAEAAVETAEARAATLGTAAH